MSPLERAVLKAARVVIVTGLRDRICFALNVVRDNPDRLQGFVTPPFTRIDLVVAIGNLKRYIREALGDGNFTLEDWQVHNGHLPWGKAISARKWDRVAWIDWMLYEEG